MGSWWVFKQPEAFSSSQFSLLRVPSSREDVFAGEGLDLAARRKLMRFLRFILDYENQEETWRPFESKPFMDFLESKFGLTSALQEPLLALTLSQRPPSDTATSFALSAISHHLKSIGIFGRGFGAVIPKWGGLSEIAQVACRAGAVGGGVYVLGQGLVAQDAIGPGDAPEAQHQIKVQLKDGDWITTNCLAGGDDDLAPLRLPSLNGKPGENDSTWQSRSVSVISSSLDPLFPPVAEGSPPPAAAVIFVPSGSLQSSLPTSNQPHPPVYIQVHSSDTGECPASQCKLLQLFTFTFFYQTLMMIDKTILIYIVCNFLDDQLSLTARIGPAKLSAIAKSSCLSVAD